MPTYRPALALSVLLASCGPKAAAPAPAPEPLPAWAESVLSDMDAGADPCQDFYRYACGGWLDRTALPADKPVWTRSFSEIAESNRAWIRGLLEKAAATPSAPGVDSPGDWKRMGNYYGACMDEDAIEAAGTKAIDPLLHEIDGISDLAGLMRVAGRLQRVGVDVLFSTEVEGDLLDPQFTILYLGQGGLGLPDRDYYLKDDDASQALLADYRAHVAEMLGLLGETPEQAAGHADAIVAFEKAIATFELPKSELRDPQRIHHKIDLSGLQQAVPQLDWAGWLDGLGAPGITDINVDEPATYASLAELLAKTDPDTVEAYLRWQTVNSFGMHLPRAFVDATFGFFGRKVYGQQENEARWKRCVRSTQAAMGEIVGRYFVEERFPGDSRQVALEMIGGIEDAFGAGLSSLEWMDDATREAAAHKKDILKNKIGYPDRWRDYSSLEIVPGDHVANVIAARSFETARQLRKVGHPTDPDEWFMPPPAVNAYFHPLLNQMVFPAGILQPPFFDHDFPAALNYGGIGMVMGHELTHGFDDQGRKFDDRGRMVEWWSPEVVRSFEERAQCVADQYSGYEVQPGLAINGQLTLGENIADIGGLRLAWRAFQADLAAHPEDAVAAGPLNPDQLFFVAAAQDWCTKAAPEYQKMLVLSNPHSPDRFRVNGPLSDLAEFHQAFSCPAGTPMHPQKTCEVW